MDGRFVAAVQNRYGTESHDLWEDWGPAQRASIYLADDGRVIVLGGGGRDARFKLPSHAAPNWIPYSERPSETGADWHYIGAVDREQGDLVFYGPTTQPECIPLYGAGFSPYRTPN